MSGVAGIYNRHQYLEERREALELWGQHIERLIVARKVASEATDTSGPARAPGSAASATVS